MAPAAESPANSDAAELQHVLTRYVDSYFGYLEAAASVESPSLAQAFGEIAGRRKAIVDRITTLIVRQGEKPETDGSTEGAIHRWWLGFRAGMTDEDLKAVLEECVRGENELVRTVTSALDHGSLLTGHALLLRRMMSELLETLQHFKSVLGNH